MKEIKFRAWDRKSKRIYQVRMIDFEQNLLSCNFDGVNGWEKFADIELMQFTGLRDKNGKEIYEGDIVKDHAWGDNQVIKVPYMEDHDGYKHTNYEIIGNIYENPEMLKKDGAERE